MKLILTYLHQHPSKEISPAVVCIEGRSVEEVRATIMQTIASTPGDQLKICGQTFDMHDFRNELHPSRLEHVLARAKVAGKPAPKYFEQGCRYYCFAKFGVFSLEDWFATNSTAFDA